jgi:hypothetical protein
MISSQAESQIGAVWDTSLMKLEIRAEVRYIRRNSFMEADLVMERWDHC